MTVDGAIAAAAAPPPRAPRVTLVHARDGAMPGWARSVGAGSAPLVTGPGAHEAASAERAAGADCVLVDAATLDPLHAARRVHQVDPDVQVVVVLETEEQRRALERALLFAPGIGEIWLASPTEVAAAIAERAAGVTRQRRKFRRTRERMERERVEASPQRTERALISDAYLADLLQVLPDPVFSVDGAGRILSANPAAARLLADPTAEVVGVPLATALGTRDGAAIAALLAAAVREPCRSEVTFRWGDGSDGHGELLVARVAASERALFAVVLHDLTEWQQAQQQLQDQAAELEHQASTLEEQAAELEQTNEELIEQREQLAAAVEARSRFYAAMSHELRTPINAVMGYAGLALEGVYGPLTDPLRDALARSQRAAAHLRELVDDVLDLAKIEAGRIDVVPEPVDVIALAEDILLSVRPTAEEGGTAIAFDCLVDTSPTIATDPRRVRQILLNLLSNALKFGAGRTVTLRCAVTADGVALSVTDEGPGIPQADQQRIFEEFVQLNPDTPEGTGLGLPISRRLAELLGGTLTVASAPGQGSTFTLALPRT